MTSLIFVHGTGGRQQEYAATFKQIEKKIAERRPDVDLFPCLWGDSQGAQLQAGGASIPTYDVTEGGRTPTAEELEIQLWEALHNDPLYELRVLGIRPAQSSKTPPGQVPAAQEMKERVAQLPQDLTLKAKLSPYLIGDVYAVAAQVVYGSKAFERMLDTAARPLEGDYGAIARAIVARSIQLCAAQGIYPMLRVDPELRREAVEIIEIGLSKGEVAMGGIIDWAKENFRDLAIGKASKWGTSEIQRQRGAITDATYPAAGDILVYQAHGSRIRTFLRTQIERPEVKPPVVLLAHSLGGVACVDLLIENAALSEKVSCLITAGSQAPFFYEIGALQTLSYPNPLPAHFPKTWLNLYDLRDFLSYIGDHPQLFGGRIKDVLVDNREPFPAAHSAYWANSQTWDEIEGVLP